MADKKENNENISEILASLEKENAELISFADMFSGLSSEKPNKEDTKEVAEEFGKSVVEEQKKDIRDNPDLDALMMGPSLDEYKKPQPKDLRENPDLDELFGVSVPKWNPPEPINQETTETNKQTPEPINQQTTETKKEEDAGIIASLGGLLSDISGTKETPEPINQQTTETKKEEDDGIIASLGGLLSDISGTKETVTNDVPLLVGSNAGDSAGNGNIADIFSLALNNLDRVVDFDEADSTSENRSNTLDENLSDILKGLIADRSIQDDGSYAQHDDRDLYQEETDSFSEMINKLGSLEKSFSPFKPEGTENKESEDSLKAQWGPLIPLGGVDAINEGKGGFELLIPIFEKLSESIDNLSAAVNKFADTLDPKEKLTEEQKAEKDYQKEHNPMWEMFQSGFSHHYAKYKKKQTEKPGDFAKDIGQSIGAGAGRTSGFVESLGAAEGGSISAAAGALGAVAAGALLAVVAIDKIKDAVMDWNESLIRSNFQFAEFSGAMAAAQAKMEVREIQYSRERGDARAESADELAKSFSELKTTFAPIADVFADMWNTLLTILNKILTGLGKLIGLNDRPEARIGTPERSFISASESAWLETYGTPLRWR